MYPNSNFRGANGDNNFTGGNGGHRNNANSSFESNFDNNFTDSSGNFLPSSLDSDYQEIDASEEISNLLGLTSGSGNSGSTMTNVSGPTFLPTTTGQQANQEAFKAMFNLMFNQVKAELATLITTTVNQVLNEQNNRELVVAPRRTGRKFIF